MSELLILPWKCPFCIGGLGPSLDGGAERCMHCAGVGLTDDPCGEAERAPRPPGVMRAPCADCAFRRGSPELENQGVQLPDDEPFFCHQGLPISALGKYTPVAMFRGLPLGAMVCAGWWALRTGEDLPTKPYREIPLTEDDVDKHWGLKAGPRAGEQPSTRCPSCDHEAKYHAADDGRCWFTVDRGVPGSNLVCPCTPTQEGDQS